MDRPRDPGARGRTPLSPAPSLLLRAARTLHRWLRPPRTLRPTRAGWSFFAITFGVGFAALNTGNNLLYLVVSLMLAFLVLSGALSESALRGISVRRRLPRELHAATPCTVGLEISNRQRRVPAFAIVVEDRIEGADPPAAGRCFALRIGPGETETRSYRFEPARRGDLRFEGFQVFTLFPFGLFSKSLALEVPESTLVYPQIERVPALHHLGSPGKAGDMRSGGRGDGPVVSGLRDWESGDPLRRIHWARSLQRDALMVREVENEECTEIEVRLRTVDHVPGEVFEQAVQWAASEVVAFLDAGSRVSLRTDQTRIPADSGPRQRSRLLAFLARVGPAGEGVARRPGGPTRSEPEASGDRSKEAAA